MRSQSMLIGAGSKNPDKGSLAVLLQGVLLKGCCGLTASRKKLSLLIYAYMHSFLHSRDMFSNIYFSSPPHG
jgi:hypothetical protein